MSFDFDTITKLIQSPPGQAVAGAALAKLVWKCFEKIEGVLNDSTKKEIARWLRVKNVESGILADEAVKWPETFAKVFDRVFGTKHLSWKCFFKSCVASLAISLVMGLVSTTLSATGTLNAKMSDFVQALPILLLAAITLNCIPDYVALLATRLTLRSVRDTPSPFRLVAAIVGDLIATAVIASIPFAIVMRAWGTALGSLSAAGSEAGFSTPEGLDQRLANMVFAVPFDAAFIIAVWFLPAFLTSIWLWLYVGSGFLLKAVRRLDVGFQWFNKKFDIEKKPLSAIGLVAGALVAVVYWGFAIGSWLMKGV